MIDGIRQDVHHAIRSLKRSPGFTLTAVSSLAICIAAGAVIFAVVTLLLSADKPVERVDRLVDVYTNVRDQPYQTSSYPDYLDLRARNTVFQDVVASGPVLVALNPGRGTRLVIGEAASGNFFQSLGVPVALGRPILPADDRPGAERVTVLAYGLWQREFGGRADVLGHTVHIRGQAYTIVGIASRTMSGMNVFPAQLWLPLTWIGDVGTMGITDYVPSPGNTPLERRGERWLFIKARLKDGQSIDRARADLRTVMNQLEAEFPGSNKGRRFSAVATGSVRVHPRADTLLAAGAGALSMLVGLLLLVACANITGLQLARATSRLREMAIRAALGASRARLIRHLLAETLLLSSAAGALAVLLVWALMTAASGADLAMPIPITLDTNGILGAPLLWFAVAASLTGGLVAGLAPALAATRSNLAVGLRKQTPVTTFSRLRWSLRDAVIIIQTAAAVLLLVVAALLTRNVFAAGRIDIGFTPTAVVAFNTGTGSIGYDSTRAQRFYADALDRIRALPDVDAISLVWRTPFDLTFAQDPILLADRHTSNEQVIPTERTIVSPEYFSTLGIRLLEGRNFTSTDTIDAPRVAIVNQTMARRYWPNGSAIGQRFRLRSLDGREYRIVGVSADYKVRTLGEAPTPYIHYAQSQWMDEEWTILVKARAGAVVPVDTIHRVLTSLDPDILFRATSMDAKVDTILLPASAAAVAMGIAGALAMLFAAVGLYGVVAFMVTQRSNEFGVRLALGAVPRQVTGLVLRRGFTLVGVGATIGGLVAAAVAVTLSGITYGVGPADPLAWSGALAVVAGVSILAHVVPARKAARVDPVQALRAE